LQAGEPREPLEKKYREVHAKQQQDILGLLTLAQKTAWQELLGANFDTGNLGRPAYRAPQFIDTGEWINGGLSSKASGGIVSTCRVVVLVESRYRTWAIRLIVQVAC